MKVTAVIVAYRPDQNTLNRILQALQEQCSVIVADNSPNEEARRVMAGRSDWRITYMSMEGNRGIGAAQNAAIRTAWSCGADAVLLLDDDSIPPVDLVAKLVACAEALGANAVVGANALNDNGIEISNAKGVPGSMPKCRDMMSSGTLIRRSIFERVGTFDESLFVDGVDFDWGWRAQQKGVPLFLCREVAIRHRLGEGRVAGIGLPTPVRHYFQYRNVIRLMSRPHTPWRWRFSQALKLPTKLAMIAMFMPDRGARLGFAFKGIRDAFLGRHGPLPKGRRVGSSEAPPQ